VKAILGLLFLSLSLSLPLLKKEGEGERERGGRGPKKGVLGSPSKIWKGSI
jgi:hypothetical protein